MKGKGICPKCGATADTRHHIIPARYYHSFRKTFGKKVSKPRIPKIRLCERCHQELERNIPQIVIRLRDCLDVLLKFLSFSVKRIRKYISGDLNLVLDAKYGNWSPPRQTG